VSTYNCSSEGGIDAAVNREETSNILKRAAEENLPAQPGSSSGYPYFFELKDGEVAARLNLTQGAFVVELVKTTKNSLNQIVYEMDDKDKRKIKVYGNYTFNKSQPKIDVKKSVTPAASGESFNKTKIDVTFTYTEKPEDKNKNDTLELTSAELKLTIEWGIPTRHDYWNITAAQLTVNAKIDSTDQKVETDLTPKFSYSGLPGDSACTNGYGICAPVGLCWSCDDQVLKPNNLKAVGEGKYTLMWHFPGMILEPEWGATKNVSASKFKFSANWDCDPLLPLSVWVSLLISLRLAAILIGAVQMLSALQVPSKWDDPKKAGIQVAQTE